MVKPKKRKWTEYPPGAWPGFYRDTGSCKQPKGGWGKEGDIGTIICTMIVGFFFLVIVLMIVTLILVI